MLFQMACIRAEQGKFLDQFIMRLFYQKIYLPKNTTTYYIFTVKETITLYTLMASKDNKALEFNQYQKSDKPPFFIYANFERLIEKIDGYKNIHQS